MEIIENQIPPCPPYRTRQNGREVDNFFVVRGPLLQTDGRNSLVLECGNSDLSEAGERGSGAYVMLDNTTDLPACPAGYRHDLVVHAPSGGNALRMLSVPAPDLLGKETGGSPYATEAFRVYLPREAVGVKYVGIQHRCVFRPWN